MLELIYPAYSAMVVCNGGGAAAAEMLPIVEPSGLVVAQASRKYCHSGTKVLHPVVHLHIVNREGRCTSSSAVPKGFAPAQVGHCRWRAHLLR